MTRIPVADEHQYRSRAGHGSTTSIVSLSSSWETKYTATHGMRSTLGPALLIGQMHLRVCTVPVLIHPLRSLRSLIPPVAVLATLTSRCHQTVAGCLQGSAQSVMTALAGVHVQKRGTRLLQVRPTPVEHHADMRESWRIKPIIRR